MSEDKGELSDGYHTFNELYEHRYALFIALCKQITQQPYEGEEHFVWRSKLHSDGTMFDGQFVIGIGRKKGKQITYHLPIYLWDSTDFIDTLEKAPEWDRHNSQDVIQRLYNL